MLLLVLLVVAKLVVPRMRQLDVQIIMPLLDALIIMRHMVVQITMQHILVENLVMFMAIFMLVVDAVFGTGIEIVM